MKRRFISTDRVVKWTVPDGVCVIRLRMAGGDAGGDDWEPGETATISEQKVDVEPGDVLEIEVGRGGNATGHGVPGLDGFVEIEY